MTDEDEDYLHEFFDVPRERYNKAMLKAVRCGLFDLGHPLILDWIAAAIEALHAFAELTEDDDPAVAIVKRLDAMADEYRQSMERFDE